MNKNNTTHDQFDTDMRKLYERFQINEYMFQIEMHRSQEKFFLGLQKFVAIISFFQALALIFYALSPDPLEVVWIPLTVIMLCNGLALTFNIGGRACMHSAWAAQYETLLQMRVNEAGMRTIKKINPE